MKIANKAPRKAVTLTCGKTRTVQDTGELTNVNDIVKQANRTGQLVNPSTIGNRKAIFGDFSSGEDFESTQNRIAVVKEEFMTLPAETRAQFDNDPAKLFEARTDPQHVEALAELGIESLVDSRPEPVDTTITPEQTPEPTSEPEPIKAD